MAKIKEVHCIRTRQNGTWVIVKIITDQPGLYGIGSASEHNHAATVATALEESLGPLLIGREASRIEDIWQLRVQQRLLAQRLHPQRRIGRH